MRQNKKIIAITGIIGSGKTTVCDILREHGEICLDCDKINYELLNSEEYLIGLKQLFPTAFIDNKLDKNILKNLIFNSSNARVKLNSYAHLKIKEKLLSQIDSISSKKIFVEIPIYNAEVFDDLVDEIWVIIAEKVQRMNRIIARDKVDDDMALKQISSQTEAIVSSKKIIYIENSGLLSDLREKIKALIYN